MHFANYKAICNCKAFPQSKVDNLTTVPFKSHTVFHISPNTGYPHLFQHKKIEGYSKKLESVQTRAPYQ